MTSHAIVSPCGLYRYSLSRVWGPGPRRMVFIMLNPSIADAIKDDPTITRCRRFAKREGMDGLIVVNLFAYRATKPAHLKAAGWPVGPDNDAHIAQVLDDALRDNSLIVFAWGANVRGVQAASAQIFKIYQMLNARRLPGLTLGMTSDGIPRHPLMLRADAPLFYYGFFS